MRGFYVAAAFVGLGLGTWVCIIIINGARKRIARINRERTEKRNFGGSNW